MYGRGAGCELEAKRGADGHRAHVSAWQRRLGVLLKWPTQREVPRRPMRPARIKAPANWIRRTMRYQARSRASSIGRI